MEKRIKWHVEKRRISQLKPYDKNPRLITEEGLKELKRSFDEIGMAQPININADNTILSGHARWNQLKSENPNQEIDVYVPDRKLTTKQEEAVIIRMNKNVAGVWDFEKLANEFEINDLFDWGFSEDELKIPDFEKIEPQTDEDDVPEIPKEPTTKRGDVWLLGEHRVKCGDSTMIDDVEKLMKGERAAICLTDPPYGLGDSKTNKNNYSKYSDSRENLIAIIDDFYPTTKSFTDLIVLTPGIKNHRLHPEPTWTMCWFTASGIGLGPWGFCCWQPILCYGKDPKLQNKKGSHPDAFEHTESASLKEHPCAKPVKLWEKLLDRCTVGNDGIIYDSFLGSGTTVIACEKTNRKCFGMELDEKYCDVIVSRWQDYTGKEATLEATGQTFNTLRK